MKTRIRTFVAVDVPDEVRRRIGEFQASLKRHGCDVKWVRPENIHITLKFIGDVQEDRIEGLSAALEGAVKGVPPFRISIEGSGLFPGGQRPRVLWVGAGEGSDMLSELASRVDLGLSALGFEKETRKYSAHLTIGRVRSPKGIQPVVDAMRSAAFEAGVVEAEEIVLMKSDLKPMGAVYTALERIKLRG